jgi:hypothetical protein
MTSASQILRLAKAAILSACCAGLLAGSSSRMSAQSRAKANPELQKFVSTDHSFEVRYPKALLVCTHLDGENPDVWSREACIAEIPVCDNSGHAGDVLACLAYPVAELGKTELQAAAFAVSRLDNLRSAKECETKWARSDTADVHGEQIGGLKFQVARALQTESSHVSEQNIYRIFRGGVCYELDVNLTTALDTAFAAEDVPRKLTAAEREKIKATLTQALEGFRFLK